MDHFSIRVYGHSTRGEKHEEYVEVQAKNRAEACMIALRKVSHKFDSNWQFYTDW